MTEAGTQAKDEVSGRGRQLLANPVVASLGEAAKNYARARATNLVGKVTGAVTERLTRVAQGPDASPTVKAAAAGAEDLAEGKSPIRAGLGAAMKGLAEKVKSALGRGGGTPKVTNIVESIDVGLPVDVVYNQWTQYPEFAKFMKGVEGVDAKSETESVWRVKVFRSRRTWTAKTQEQVPDRRIAWTSEGAKGSTRGVVTFHPLADDLTRVLLVMEYYPQGLFEKTGNIWRAGGRRARLDLKHFRRFVSLNGKETGSWRGEIRDGEVVGQPDEEQHTEDQAQDAQRPDDDEQDDQHDDQHDDHEDDQDESEEEPAGAPRRAAAR
nr:SRPBCC family protein [uncultured Actinoplanes sp.]